MYNITYVNIRFRGISPLDIYFSDGGELGIINIRSLIKKFGSLSGVVLEVQ